MNVGRGASRAHGCSAAPGVLEACVYVGRLFVRSFCSHVKTTELFCGLLAWRRSRFFA